METKICTKCSRKLPLEKFHKKGKGRNSKCGECISTYYRERYHNDPERKRKHLERVRKNNLKKIDVNRRIILDYLAEHPCPCGEGDPMILQFDHDDATLKLYNVTDMVTHSTKKLVEEMKKCTVRCANCHTRRTNEQFGWWKTNLPDIYPLADNE